MTEWMGGRRGGLVKRRYVSLQGFIIDHTLNTHTYILQFVHAHGHSALSCIHLQYIIYYQFFSFFLSLTSFDQLIVGVEGCT